MEFDFTNAVDYHYGKFPPNSIDYEKLMPSIIEATDALARYDQILKGMHNSEIFLAPLRNQEAVISSRMEGTISTMDEILRLEAEHGDDIATGSKMRSEAAETFLYQRALRSAQKSMAEGRPLSASLIKSIHQQLLSFGRGMNKNPGAFKTEQNYIGERGSRIVNFIPISPEKLDSAIQALFDEIAKPKWPILLRAALCHVEFEALHPFKDGNGRVGRMMITLMLWSEGAISAPHFYISRFFEDYKAEYLTKMRDVSDSNNWDDWCIFFLTAVKEQANNNLETAENILSLYEEMKEQLSDLLSSKWSVNALDFLFTYPVFYNSTFTSKAGIPSQTASRFTRLLLNAEILQTVEEASGSKAAIYRFEPLVKLVRV